MPLSVQWKHSIIERHGGRREKTQLFIKLLSLKLPGLRDFDHDAGMDFADERDGSFPDPVHVGELALISTYT